MMAATVYLLCGATSALCALLLFRQYARRRERLLMWGGLSFIGFAVSNALVFADFIVWPDSDLALIRALSAFASVSVLVWGLIWDTH